MLATSGVAARPWAARARGSGAGSYFPPLRPPLRPPEGALGFGADLPLPTLEPPEPERLPPLTLRSKLLSPERKPPLAEAAVPAPVPSAWPLTAPPPAAPLV